MMLTEIYLTLLREGIEFERTDSGFMIPEYGIEIAAAHREPRRVFLRYARVLSISTMYDSVEELMRGSWRDTLSFYANMWARKK